MAIFTYQHIVRNVRKRAKAEAKVEVAEGFVTNLILQTDFDNEKISSLVNVPLEFVKQIQEKLAKNLNVYHRKN